MVNQFIDGNCKASLLTAVLAEVLHGRFNCADLFIDFLQAFDKDVMSLEEMAETDYCENDSNDIMPETMTIVWILVDAEDYETCYDCA